MKNKQHIPPKLAQRFLLWFLRDELVEEVLGDLEEKYIDKLEENSAFRAKINYWYQVFNYLRPFAIRKSGTYTYTNHYAMYRSYFKIGYRNLLMHKGSTLINILGLAVGMGVCLLIYQYIHFELSYDRFHENIQNTYRITFTGTSHGEDFGFDANTTYGLGPAAKEMIPEMEAFVRTHSKFIGPIVTNPEKNEPYQENSLLYVDHNFLQMFNFPLKYGDQTSALNGKYDVVITEHLAAKYFGDTNPIGKVLKFSLGALGGDFTVTGVLQNLPVNSHIQFDILLPLTNLLENYGAYKAEEGWTWDNFTTYVALNDQANLKEVSGKFDQVINVHLGEELDRANVKIETVFQSLADIHLRSGSTRNIRNIQLFTLIAIFILLMAWMNYINLSTARAMQRAKEVGVRKSIGALKNQLISQFLMESLFINVMAALLAIGIAYVMLPALNHIIGKELTLSVVQSVEFWTGFILFVILGTLLSGLYPAFILSSFKPISVLKSAKVSMKHGFHLRRGLIAFQFMISILLISGTYLVYKQVTFMKDQDVGIDMEKILVINGPIDLELDNLRNLYETFKNEAIRHHSVAAISGTGTVPGTGNMFRGHIWREDKPRNTGQQVNVEQVDVDFIKLFDLQILAGQDFTNDMQRIRDNGPVLINEEAVKAFGFDSPEDAIHQKLIAIVGDTMKMEVVGIVKDFYWNSLQEAHMPYVFALNHEYGAYFSFRINLSDIPETIAYIKASYEATFPGNPFEYYFLDDHFNQQYQADLQFGNLFSAFSLLAIFIACIGLFALVSYSATLRIREIGIRKVLGADIGHLMMLLSREYMFLLLIAVAIAIPAVYWGGNAWLENYAYKVGISIDLFLIPGLILLLISFLTVSYRTYAAARANPVDSLKSE